MKYIPAFISLFILGTSFASAATVSIAVSPQAPTVISAAATDLATDLQQLYPQDKFPIVTALPPTGDAILIGAISDPTVKEIGNAAGLAGPESYAISHTTRDNREVGVIAGAEARGASYGVYQLLEKLGCGFYESCDIVPPAKGENFSFKAWSLANAPVVATRFIFNWHNFLSGCSTWDLPDWKKWILQSHKMGFNGIMVHTYGNNPMTEFTFNGQTRPVGWLTTTAKGRDWGTQHVDNVRQMYGGDAFNGPVFGSEVALVDDKDRVRAIKTMMGQVFDYAKSLDMEVYLAVDIDTKQANPKNMIATLPDSAQLQTDAESKKPKKSGKSNSFANVATPEGKAYYQAMFGTLLTDYPQIDHLVFWIRALHSTPMLQIKRTSLPADWLPAYDAAAAAAKLPETSETVGPSLFNIGQVAKAARTILDGSGHKDVTLGLGSWGFVFMAPADAFLPPEVRFYPLDANIDLNTTNPIKLCHDVSLHRPVNPIVWVQHDDFSYLGRPFTPFAKFATLLEQCGASGFGVIHWMTHPYDLYFKSVSDQTWRQTRDEPLAATCNHLGDALISGEQGQAVGEYLNQWMTEGPHFGRETGEALMGPGKGGAPAAAATAVNSKMEEASARQRLALLDKIDESKLTSPARSQLDFYKNYEKFCTRLFQDEEALRRSRELLTKNDLAGARTAMESTDPGAVIDLYRESLRDLGVTKGEQGILVSLNLRWLPYFVRQQQELGLEPVRVAFGPTQHDPLAQFPGTDSFRFRGEGKQKELWQVLGQQETGLETYESPVDSTNATAAITGIRLATPYTYKSVVVPAGNYTVTVLTADPDHSAPGARTFSMVVNGVPAGPAPIDVAGQTPASVSKEITQARNGSIEIILTPVHGDAVISGLIIAPAPAR